MIGKIYFDTSIFIYALENDLPKAQALFSDAMQSGHCGISVITVMEYYTGCYKRNRYDMIKKFNRFVFDGGFEVVAIDTATAVEAAKIRTEYVFFKQMDALQLASAKVAGADIFYTNDKQLLQYHDEKLRVLTI